MTHANPALRLPGGAWMASSDESIRQQIESCGPLRRGRRFTSEVREEVVAHARAATARGRSRASVAKAVGIRDQTLARWLRAGAFVPVEIDAQPTAGGIVVTSPSGWRVEGLKLEQLAELLRRAS